MTSVRLRGEPQHSIRGTDRNIYGPGLGANLDNYGGEQAEIDFGVHWMPILADSTSM